MKTKFIFMMCFAFMAMFGLGHALFDQVSLEIQETYSNDTVVVGSTNFSFNIYDTYTGGTSLYESNQTLTTDSTGLVSVILKNIDLNFNESYYIGLNVNDDGEQTPRINWTDVGTAINSDAWDNIDTSDDFVNITASGSIKGQPITGSIGSGIINSSENLDHCGCMNITINQDREVHYPEFTARVVDTDGTVIDCYKAEGDMNVTDNLQSTYYLNSSCEWNSETFETFHSADMSPGGKVRIFDALTINGVVEETKGNTLLALAKDKAEQIRIFCSSSSHLSVCNGFEITHDTFPSFNVSSGNSVYLNTYLPTDAKSTLTDETHLTHHENGSWVHTNITGLNITYCDNGTDLVECTGTVFRQYPVYSESWNSDAKIHMLSPLTTGATYTSLSACVAATPDYSLPSMEKYVAIMHHIYCARRTDTVWNSDAWIDLRSEPVGVGGTPDLSPYLTIYADKPLLSNWDIGAYNFTNTDSWFLGNTLWDNLEGWDNFTGIPHATPSNGDITHFSLADEIYDWVIGLGYTTNTGTVTSIATGNGISGGTITTSGTLTVAGNTALTADADGLSVTADAIGDTQLAFNTGQHLTTTSDVKFDDINVTGNITFQTGFGVCYNSVCSDYKYYNGTCEITYIGGTTLTICPA